ncbi:hypothetical protein ILUMI_04002 [Ignelater luminosus]|uniref:Uncharacterized protein n=1 Tax=Ignelater luminosus TaxID=2038154 RepID=A0A8K0DKN0_IGNLU|nr:hypothetical protein ILUMI_04002 [Ignelater luminosus]
MKIQENSKDITSVGEDKMAGQRQPRSTLSGENDLISPSTSQIRIKLSATALTSDQFGLSDRAVAVVASSMLEDVGLIFNKDFSLVVDRKRIRREKYKARKTLQFIQGLSPLRGLYLDGRKDNTMVLEQNGATFYRREVVLEHINLIQEPEGQFLEHVTPASGTGLNIANSIFQYISESHYDLNTLLLLGVIEQRQILDG